MEPRILGEDLKRSSLFLWLSWPKIKRKKRRKKRARTLFLCLKDKKSRFFSLLIVASETHDYFIYHSLWLKKIHLRNETLQVSLGFVLKPSDNLRFRSSFHIHLAVLKADNFFIHQLQDISCHWVSRWVLHPLTGIMEPSPSKLIQGN